MTRRLGLGAALTGLLVAAVSTFAVPSATAADPMLRAPVVGQCSDMSTAELAEASYGEAPVDCAGKHSAHAIALTQVPDGIDYDTRALLGFALETCSAAQRTALGTNRLTLRLTAYDLGYFGPTAEELAAGARWLRCNLVLVAGRKLAPLPGTLEVGRFPFEDAVSRCLGGRRFTVTTCSSRHSFRATAALKVREAGDRTLVCYSPTRR